MRALFIESSEFTGWVSKHLPNGRYAELQQELMRNPQKGDLIPGCGGLRKVRTGDPRRGKGKRGGVRVIYLHVPEAKWFFMLDVYGKDEKDDLAVEEKRILRQKALEFKNQAKRSVASEKRKESS